MSEVLDELRRQRKATQEEQQITNQQMDIPWYEVFRQAGSNLGPSIMGVAEDLVYPFLNPVLTAESVLSLGKGIYQLTTEGEQPDEATARAVGKYFVDRYGSMVGFKNALAQDPAGVMADASLVVTGAATGVGKVGSMAGKSAAADSVVRGAGKVKKLADAIDPINLVAKGAAGAVKNTPSAIAGALGVTSGVGDQPIREAFQAGREGGERQKAFLENMRGEVDVEEVAVDALDAMREQRRKFSDQYTDDKNMLMLGSNEINMPRVVSGIQDLRKSFEYEGMSELSPQGQKKLATIEKLVGDWDRSPGMHNAKGLDFLKRRIDNEYPTGINPGDSSVVVTRARKIVKDAITEQVPDYAKVMKPYEEAVKLEREMQRALSLGKNSSADTILRKLQSVMRNNVNANFGSRLKLVQELEKAGDYLLLPKIAGQTLNTPFPRGISRLGPLTGGAVAVGTGNTGALVSPLTGAALATTSPRLVGETANMAGRITGAAVDPMLRRMDILMGNPKVRAVSNVLQQQLLNPQDALDVARRARATGALAQEGQQPLSLEQLRLLRSN